VPLPPQNRVRVWSRHRETEESRFIVDDDEPAMRVRGCACEACRGGLVGADRLRCRVCKFERPLPREGVGR
jgi:hypothetical protein